MMNNIKTIKAIGMDSWLKRREKRWRCTECGTAFWWYQKACEACGAELYSSEAEAAELDAP